MDFSKRVTHLINLLRSRGPLCGHLGRQERTQGVELGGDGNGDSDHCGFSRDKRWTWNCLSSLSGLASGLEALASCIPSLLLLNIFFVHTPEKCGSLRAWVGSVDTLRDW